jgi:hypothetical protein
VNKEKGGKGDWRQVKENKVCIYLQIQESTINKSQLGYEQIILFSKVNASHNALLRFLKVERNLL